MSLSHLWLYLVLILYPLPVVQIGFNHIAISSPPLAQNQHKDYGARLCFQHETVSVVIKRQCLGDWCISWFGVSVRFLADNFP